MSQKPPRPALVPPPPPVVPADVSAYQQVLMIGATAIANAMAAQQGMKPARNMLDLVDPNTRKTCIEFAKAVVDAVSRHGVAQAQGAAAGVQKQTREQEILASVCADCNAGIRTAERDGVTKVVHVVYTCGAEKLAFDEGQWTERRLCPVGRPIAHVGGCEGTPCTCSELLAQEVRHDSL